MRDRPLYSISTVAELLDVHPETLRVWDRHGLLRPARKRGQRCYTDADLQRLLFIRHMIDRWGLNLSGVQAYLRLYPCWSNDRCPSVHCTGSQLAHAKPCWRRPHEFCGSAMLGSEPCGSCNGHPPASMVALNNARAAIPVSAVDPAAPRSRESAPRSAPAAVHSPDSPQPVSV